VYLALDERPSAAVSRAGRAWVCWNRMGKIAPYDYDVWARYSDDVVPVEGVTGFRGEAEPSLVRLSWETSEYGLFEVYRSEVTLSAPVEESLPPQVVLSEECSSLLPLEAVLVSPEPVGGRGTVTFEDFGVTPGTGYVYWLGQLSATDCRVFGPLRVDVPLSGVPGVSPLLVVSPNPFRSGCVVRSSVGNTARVFDVHGRFVRELQVDDGMMGEDDSVSFYWDGKDANGGDVASGVYVVRVTDRHDPKTEEVVGKLLLLR